MLSPSRLLSLTLPLVAALATSTTCFALSFQKQEISCLNDGNSSSCRQARSGATYIPVNEKVADALAKLAGGKIYVCEIKSVASDLNPDTSMVQVFDIKNCVVNSDGQY